MDPVDPSLGGAEFLEEATGIARQILDQAIETRQGLVWPAPPAQRHREPNLGPYLYDGTTGIALFLAALARASGDGSYRERSLQAIAPLRRRLAEMTSRPSTAGGLKLRVGGLLGLGAFLYSFLKIGEFLDEPALLQEARNVLVLLTLERIEADAHLDVASGSAGAVLSLLALDSAIRERGGHDSAALEIASLCAEHLLNTRLEVEPGRWGWRTVPGHPPLAGFSHGAGGICYSLLRLHERTGRPELLQAVRHGLAYERGLYSPEHKNWKDLRFSDGRFMTSWCHGAPGVALSRLGMLGRLDDPEISGEIRAALETTRSFGLAPIDHLCCGNMGRADILVYAFQKKLQMEASLQDSRLLATQVLRRAAGRGFFGKPRSDGYSNPSLFLGTAGVGYTLLRLADPDALPCLLILE